MVGGCEGLTTKCGVWGGYLKNMFQTTSLKAKRLRTAQHTDLEEAALVWFKQQRLLNLPISGPILKAKTDQLAEKLKIENFKCSASYSGTTLVSARSQVSHLQLILISVLIGWLTFGHPFEQVTVMMKFIMPMKQTLFFQINS